MQTVHPSPEAIRLAMFRIERAMELYGGDREAPMDWGIVHRHDCRTTACHGGWYALGRLMDHPAIRWRHDETFYNDPGETMMALRRDGTVTHLMYHEGAHMLARDLGFMNAPACKAWAERHPQIWGNGHGERMFAGDGALAFGKQPFAPVLVSEIVAWWRAVADRLDAAIEVHPDGLAALAALQRHDAYARKTLAVEPCTGGYRIVRQPRPIDPLSLQPRSRSSGDMTVSLGCG